MGRFIKPVTEQSGFDTAMQQRELPAQAGPKGLAAPESSASSPSDNRPLNALPAVTIPANDAAMEELEQPLLPKTTPDRAERILNDAALAAAAGAASAMIAGGADTTIPDVEVLPLDQSPLHVQGEEGPSAAAADPFADIYQDFKQRELSPESTGAYVPLKGNDTASPVRLGGYGTAPSPLTARGITRPPVHERGDLDPLYSATAYELLPQDRNQGDAIVNQFDHLLGTQTEQQQQPSAAAGAIILGDVPETAVVAPTLLEDMQLIEAPSAIASGTTAQSAAGTTKQPYLRRGAGLTAAAAKTQPTMSRRLQRGRSYDPFAAVDAALAELGHDSGKQQRALVRTQKTSLEVSDRPLRHWGSEVAVVLQPDIDQAPNFKKSFARTHSKVNRKQRCFLSTAQREANTIEMPDFTVSTPAPNAPGTQPVKRNSFRANRMLAPENDAMRGIDELLLNKKPLRHWGYEPAIVCQPDIDQAPNYKKRFTLRRPKNTIGAHRSSFRGSHRGGVAWFIPFAGGCLRTKGGLAWAIDTGAAAQTDAGEQPQITQALVVYDGPTDGDAIPLPAPQHERASYDARPQSLAAASAKTEDGSVEDEEPRYWKRTDSTVTSNSLNGTATGDDDASSGKKKHKSGLKKLASKLIHGFHKSKKNKHAEDGDGNNNTLPPTTVFNAPRTVRTAAYPLGLPVAPVVEKKRMKELKKHGIAVPVAVAGDQRADPAFAGPQRVTCAEQPTTPVPIATLSPSAIHNGNIGPAFVAPPTESPATAAIAADPAVLAVGPKAVNTADAEEHRVSAFSG